MCWHIVMQQNPTACSPNFLAVFTMETSAICLMHYHHILSESRFMLLSMNKTHNFTFVAYSIKNIFNDNGATCITHKINFSHISLIDYIINVVSLPSYKTMIFKMEAMI